MRNTAHAGHTGDLLIRALPDRVLARLKVAAALHQQSMNEYVRALLASHLDDLERHGVKLELPPSAGRPKS